MINPKLLADLAMDIADESECSVIECHCPHVRLGNVVWYDTADVPPTEPGPLLRAQVYLAYRGLLIRHPEKSHLVRIKSANTLGQISLQILGMAK
jgi:hypothetical protein